MNKQLIQDVIKAGNKAMNSVPVKYTVDTRDEVYYLQNISACHKGNWNKFLHISFKYVFMYYLYFIKYIIPIRYFY